MTRSPNRRAKRKSDKREPHWNAKWWPTATEMKDPSRLSPDTSLILQPRSSTQRSGMPSHSLSPGFPWRLEETCMPEGSLCIISCISWQRPVRSPLHIHKMW